MFNKIHLKFYDILFDICGKIGRRYWYKAKKERALHPNGTKWHKYERKAWKYIEARENILQIEFKLKSLI
jgi:hypothetical protein